jgi:hypothetical protein
MAEACLILALTTCLHFKATHLDWFRLLAGKGHPFKISFLTFIYFRQF